MRLRFERKRYAPSHARSTMHLSAKSRKLAYSASRGVATRAAPVLSDYASVIPTFHFQDSLPRLPIPELNKTLEKCVQATNFSRVLA